MINAMVCIVSDYARRGDGPTELVQCANEITLISSIDYKLMLQQSEDTLR